MINRIFKISFYAYLVLYPMIPDIVNEKAPVGDLLLLIFMGMFLIKSISTAGERGKFLRRIRECSKDIIVITMILSIGLMIISSLYATNKLIALTESFRYFTYIIIYIAIKYEFNINEKFNELKLAIFGPAFLIFVYGIIQRLTGLGLNVDTNGTPRIESTLGYPTAYGAYIVILLFPLIMFALNEGNKRLKIFYSLSVALGIVNMVLTWSRNAWLAFAVGLVALAIFYSWKFIIAFLGAGLGAMIIPFTRLRLLQVIDSMFNDGRIKLWQAGFKMIEENPFTGVGNGNFTILYDSYVERYPELYIPGHSGFPIHNSYLKMWVEIGPLGMISFFSTYVFMGIKLFLLNKRNKDKYNGFITGALVTFITFLVLNIFDNMLFTPKVTMMFFLIVSMALTSNVKEGKYKSNN